VLRDAEAGARRLQEQRGPSLATIKDLDGQLVPENPPTPEDPPATA
jgi:hypothetical protein